MNLPSTTTPEGLFNYMMVVILFAAILALVILYF